MPTEKYVLKLRPELGYAVLTGVVVVAGEMLLTLDPSAVSDWKTWGLGALGALARAVGAAVLNSMLRGSA